MRIPKIRPVFYLIMVIAMVAIFLLWRSLSAPGLPAGIAAGNGRIEATAFDISALDAGRIDKINADEGDEVAAGDLLVQMDIVQLMAQKRQAEAELRRARIGIDTAEAQVRQAQAEQVVAEASVAQAQAAADAASARYARTSRLSQTNIISQQTLDDDEASDRQAKAGLASAEASKAAAEASVSAARAQVVDAEASVEAAQAAIDSVSASIRDSRLVSPRDGRVQYLVAHEGEVVSAGGRILNLVDLTDVYMTFFLPTSQAGLVQVGSEARLVLDAAPDFVVPATISYVADVAQFTPKTVETADEREKLMFRVRARIAPDLLRRYRDYVKTGVPGMAYVRTDPETEWPAFLGNLVP